MENHMASPPPPPANDPNGVSHKRKRSSSPSNALPTPPPAKAPRTANSSHLHINYLVRQYDAFLPLITSENQPLPALLALISDYEGVIQRHESMAGNMGARPLGPMIIKRFERLFDAPPRVLKTHGKEGTQINWLDVVDFARNKPEQFNLEKMRDGIRVCQFYTKQCRVEISEDDFELLRSGVPQKMIPPQPIGEDEEKELVTLEILEKNLAGVVQLADQVSARARQLNHRLKNRTSAINSRRMAEAEARRDDEGVDSPTLREHQANGYRRPSLSPPGGFTAVNTKPALANGQANRSEEYSRSPATTNGHRHGASAAIRDELLSKFRTASDRDAPTDSRVGSRSFSSHRPALPAKSKNKSNYSPTELDYPNNLIAAASQLAVPIPHTPTSLLLHTSASSKPTAAESREDNGPYKADMMLRMEQLNREDRVQPPCDRCRRLHMDCLKNLTACIGCTKKHAKCSWKDVTERELRDFPFVPRVALEADNHNNANNRHRGSKGGKGSSDDLDEDDDDGVSSNSGGRQRRRDWNVDAKKTKTSREVRDEELLGEDEDSDDEYDDDDDGTAAREKILMQAKSHKKKPKANVAPGPLFPNLPMSMSMPASVDTSVIPIAAPVTMMQSGVMEEAEKKTGEGVSAVIPVDMGNVTAAGNGVGGPHRHMTTLEFLEMSQAGMEIMARAKKIETVIGDGSVVNQATGPADPDPLLTDTVITSTARSVSQDDLVNDDDGHTLNGTSRLRSRPERSRHSSGSGSISVGGRKSGRDNDDDDDEDGKEEEDGDGSFRRDEGDREEERPSSAAGMRWDEKSGRMRL